MDDAVIKERTSGWWETIVSLLWIKDFLNQLKIGQNRSYVSQLENCVLFLLGFIKFEKDVDVFLTFYESKQLQNAVYKLRHLYLKHQDFPEYLSLSVSKKADEKEPVLYLKHFGTIHILLKHF